MSNKETLFLRHRKRQLFRSYRYALRYPVGALFMSFGIIDFLYIPRFWIEGLCLRFSLWGFLFLSFELMKVRRIRNRYSVALATLSMIYACWIVNWMFFRSGGYSSVYLTGLLLVNVTGLHVFGFRRFEALFINLTTYIPTFVIIWISAGKEHWREALIQTSFLVGMTCLAWLYGNTGSDETESWIKRQLRLNQELGAFRRTEFLKKYFPPPLRLAIEREEISLKGRKKIQDAAVGFADIAASTTIANQIGLEKDWMLKEKFLEAATRRATESGMIVLSQQGDGCFFLANFSENENWETNIIAFFENLSSDFRSIKLEVNLPNIETGIKFGISLGPALVGFIGRDQSHFTANGPVVNLASRLCAEANIDELVVSDKVWDRLKKHLVNWKFSLEAVESLKGFSGRIDFVRISPRLSSRHGGKKCGVCGAPVFLISDKNGILDIACSSGHSGEAIVFSDVSSSVKKAS